MRLQFFFQFVIDTSSDAAVLGNKFTIVSNGLARIDGLDSLATTTARGFIAFHGKGLVTFWILKLSQSIFSLLPAHRLLQLWFDRNGIVLQQILLLLIVLLEPFGPQIRFSIVCVLLEFGQHVVQHTEPSLTLLLHHDILFLLDLSFVRLKYLLC